MKKTLLYSLAAFAALGLASCSEDYDDWANPQSYGQDAAAAKYGLSFAAGSEITSTLPDADGLVHLVTVSTTDTTVSGYTIKTLTINGTDVTGSMVGNDICVDANTLEKLVEKENDSRAAVARPIEVKANVSMNLDNGDAVTTETVADITGSVTPQPTPAIDEKGYYILGAVAENIVVDAEGNPHDWQPSKPVYMTASGDGIFKVKVTTTSDADNYFKFYSGSHYSADNWDVVNAGQIGCETNGDASTHNFVVYQGDPLYTGGVQTPVIHGAGTWIVTLDMKNLTYTVSNPVLYVAGNANGWKQIEPLASADGVAFSGFASLDGKGFKFCSQKDWNGTNYGQDFSTAADAANWALPSGYADGYYKIDLNVDNKTMTLTPISAIGIIGDATVNGWDGDVDMTYNAETHAWEAKNVVLKQGTLKFRANHGWDINWGGTVDNLVQGGPNVNVDAAGTYDVALYAWADGYAYCTLTAK